MRPLKCAPTPVAQLLRSSRQLLMVLDCSLGWDTGRCGLRRGRSAMLGLAASRDRLSSIALVTMSAAAQVVRRQPAAPNSIRSGLSFGRTRAAFRLRRCPRQKSATSRTLTAQHAVAARGRVVDLWLRETRGNDDPAELTSPRHGARHDHPRLAACRSASDEWTSAGECHGNN